MSARQHRRLERAATALRCDLANEDRFRCYFDVFLEFANDKALLEVQAVFRQARAERIAAGELPPES